MMMRGVVSWESQQIRHDLVGVPWLMECCRTFREHAYEHLPFACDYEDLVCRIHDPHQFPSSLLVSQQPCGCLELRSRFSL